MWRRLLIANAAGKDIISNGATREHTYHEL
jgi:hypothetical protein